MLTLRTLSLTVVLISIVLFLGTSKTLQLQCQLVDTALCPSGYRNIIWGQNFNTFVCLDSEQQCQTPYEAVYELTPCSTDIHNNNCETGVCYTATNMASCSNNFNCSVGPYLYTYNCQDCQNTENCDKCLWVSIFAQQPQETSCLGNTCQDVGATSGIVDTCNLAIFGDSCTCCLTGAISHDSICTSSNFRLWSNSVTAWVLDLDENDLNQTDINGTENTTVQNQTQNQTIQNETVPNQTVENQTLIPNETVIDNQTRIQNNTVIVIDNNTIIENETVIDNQTVVPPIDGENTTVIIDNSTVIENQTNLNRTGDLGQFLNLLKMLTLFTVLAVISL